MIVASGAPSADSWWVSLHGSFLMAARASDGVPSALGLGSAGFMGSGPSQTCFPTVGGGG